MDVFVDNAADIVGITATSLESAKRINEKLGIAIAGYEESNGRYHDSKMNEMKCKL